MVFKKLLSKGKKEHDGDGPSTSQRVAAAKQQEEEQVVYHPDADENGGMLCTNDELLKDQREAIMQWVKSMGRRLLTGSINLINTPFPVTIFEPRSYLEKLADVWVYPRYLTAASQTSDPVERMKLVTTWFVAGLHHAFANWRKPFNPILGETWQATLSDGTCMFMEQISHHPPVSAFHMEGPGGSYCFRGLSQPTVSIVVKYYGFKTVAKGFRYVEFPDGSRIELHYPQYIIKNVVYGGSRPRAEVDGQAILVDVRHKLKTVIHFGALKGARNKVLRRADAVYGFIYDCRNNQASLEEKTSTADLAEALEEVRTSYGHAHTHDGVLLSERGGNGLGHSGHGGGDDDDEEEFASASENEYDAEREEADAAAALERAAAAAAAEADGSLAVAVAAAAAAASGDSPPDNSSPLYYGSLRGGGGGGGGGEDPSGGAGHGSDSGAAGRSEHGSNGRIAGAESSGGSHGMPKSSHSFPTASGGLFGMGAFNKMGTLLRLAQPPTPTNVEPTPSEMEGVPLARIEGSWLSHVAMDGRRYWSVATEPPDRWRPAPDPLPSDCRYRQDLVVLAGGDVKAAQRTKEALENMQRHDKKIREAAHAAASTGRGSSSYYSYYMGSSH